MRDQKKGEAVWTAPRPYVQQKDPYLREGTLKGLLDALTHVVPSRRRDRKETSRS